MTTDLQGKELKQKKVLQGTDYQYELGDKLGKGSYATVRLGQTVEEPVQTFAIKIFKVGLLKRRRMWDSQVAGFKTAFLSGSCVAASRLGGPDLDLLSFGEMFDSFHMVHGAAPECSSSPTATTATATP